MATTNDKGLLGSVGGSALVSAAAAAGIVLLFVGERMFGAGQGRTVADAVGALLLVVAGATRMMRVMRASSDARWIERRALDLTLLLATAVLLYFVQSDVFHFAFGGKSLAVGWPKVAVAVDVLWPALWLASALPLLLVELSYASMARSAHLEIGRVRDALLSGLGLGFVLVFAVSTAYVADARDARWDLSYFRTTRPGESTRKLVRTFTEPVTITYFFPAGSDVREEVRAYLEDLARESPNLKIDALDQAVDPTKAKELGVTANGAIVVAKGARKEQLSIGIELEAAKTQLKSLDKEVQKRLLQVSRPGRTVYLTTGHGERASDNKDENDKRGTVRELRSGLQELSYTVKDLGAAEGLAAEVPSDAGMVMILGPQKPLLPEEAAAIKRYVERGGRVFLALDPEAGLDGADLLSPYGVAYHPQALANDQQYARRYNQASDKVNIVTGSYSSHPAVQTLGKARAPVILLGAGYLDEVGFKDRPKGVVVDMSIHAMPQTWADLDGNFAFDPPKESRRAYELAAAITRKPDAPAAGDAKAPSPNDEGRVFVLTDSDAITDVAILSVGNRYLLLDPIRWLSGDEAIAGETSSETDVPITHTKSQDVLWFYGAIFLAPAIVLGVGFWATRRGRRKKARPAAPPSAAAGAGSHKEAA